ncbi:serine hydrolase [Clostridium botulinum]|uniref:serine hydrolase domain-containing protein n=1 Tax=unclassified Clostridium TaxID=2614128 RepID=UPI0005063B9C|nr:MULTISPECIES: serine hydrolase domain-containing protein [unclassified Clostridium]KFX55330.1 beta-lactamase [Clostridium botulinum]MBY6777834.1 beta-lactamase family protein [Clostridium botulinum]MBY6851259.1 beta-lactamase family protein [Clostridium botulinum]NFF24111.1 serine hydrolase [Clostridium botulinum]NFF36856.1 serine hydrolase [Clostridium botulinum]
MSNIMKRKKNLLKSIILIIALMGIAFSVFNVIKNKDNDYIDKLIEKYSPQGAAIAVIENGEITEVRNYGYSNIESKSLVNNETQFKIASISKSITSYAVMKLVDEGKLNLDEPINTYLTKWKLPDTEFDENKLTLRTLMSHTSGITGSNEIGYESPLPTIEDALKIRDIKLKREPGEVFEYSEFAGLGICQLIIEEVTGEKFEKYMEDEVFKKLGMNNTNYDNEIGDNLLAVPYAGINKPIKVTPIVMNGGGGVSTTASDLAKFTIELINYHNNGNGEMFKAQKNTESVGGKYGLGIIPRELKNGKTVYEHNGTLTGWNAQMAMEPISEDGIVILTNSDKAFFLTYELMEKWGEKAVGEKVIDTKINTFVDMVYKCIAVLFAILTLLIIIFIIKVKKGKIVLLERKKRNRKYLISAIFCTLLAVICFVSVYTEITFKLLFNMNDYYVFTFFPPSFIWVNVLLSLFGVFIVLRSGYTKEHKKTLKDENVK